MKLETDIQMAPYFDDDTTFTLKPANFDEYRLKIENQIVRTNSRTYPINHVVISWRICCTDVMASP